MRAPSSGARSPEAQGTAASALAAELWAERELLDQLLFALTTQQLMLTAGQLRWLAAVDAQVAQAVEALSDGELRRAIASTQLADAVGLPGDATLDELAGRAPEPWAYVLADHRDALRAAAGEVSAVSAENRRLLTAGADLARDALAQIGSAVAGYGDPASNGYPTRTGAPLAARPVLFDGRA